MKAQLKRPRKPACPFPLTLLIPVKPYILKFLRKHVGANYTVTNDDAFGRQLKEHMRSRPQKIARNKGLHRYKAVWAATASSKDFKSIDHLELTSLSMVRFNKDVELICSREFHSMVDMYTQDGGQTIQYGIDKFRTKFGLTEEDWDSMTMRRSYLRYRSNPEDKAELEKTPVRNYFRRECDCVGTGVE